MSLKLKIMLRAVKIRMGNGENIDEILNSYPRLTDDEKKVIKMDLLPD